MTPNLDAVPVHDHATCMELLEGDHELYQELLALFRESTGEILDTLEEANREGDWDQVRMTAHSLKGSSANLSVERLHALATLLEESLRNGHTVDVDAYAVALRREFDAFVELTT